MTARSDNRSADDLREVKIEKGFLTHPMGSVLISMGRTRAICSASVVPGVPRWMRDQKVPGGWLTSEYRMLPASTHTRRPLMSGGRIDGRSQEIQRIIGRSLRAIVDLTLVGARTIYVDCEVIDADGGTRCTCINGASIALQLAFRRMFTEGELNTLPVKENVAAISVGIVDGEPILDLCYEEDSSAEVDMNVVMTEAGELIEVQGTAEKGTFSRAQMNQLLDLADKGIKEVFAIQKDVLAAT